MAIFEIAQNGFWSIKFCEIDLFDFTSFFFGLDFFKFSCSLCNFSIFFFTQTNFIIFLQAKHESTIGELEEKLRKDNQQRQEVERAKRKIETELNDLKEQVGEKKMQVIKIDEESSNGFLTRIVALCLIFMILVSLENVKKYSNAVARLPQRLKSTLFEIFSNGGCPKGTRSVENISNNVDFSL